jgi:hypothetical protein
LVNLALNVLERHPRGAEAHTTTDQ